MLSSAASSSRSSTPDLPINLNTKKAQKKTTSSGPRNEGLDPDWAYTPPSNYVLLQTNEIDYDAEFDWDTLNNNPNLEVWLIRMPDNLAPKHLDSVSLTLPPDSPSPSQKPLKAGQISRKHTTYDVWSTTQNASQIASLPETDAEGDGLDTFAFAEEMKSLYCLFPRKSKGDFLTCEYTAYFCSNATFQLSKRREAVSKSISRHVTILPQPATPQAVPVADSPSLTLVHQNPPRESYPPEVLKHRFIPYGSLAPDPDEVLHTIKKLKKQKVESAKHESSQEVDMTVDDDGILESGNREKKKGKRRLNGIVQVTDVENVVKSVADVDNAEDKSLKGKKRKGVGEAVVDAGKKSKKLKSKHSQ
ncbi:hypothetical protein AMATHDRAFT_45438 [Amanita thiersii Skay4041]|uniref:Uncharacterized protein n=1 Tax=Amanita thiersii Skay4041 TaxID=703135 RepID=A0A2A9NYG7_9AGAR|nr:hypothetical protein AMATHDRAFT_45438 [Amanita thiersii Skay4041]